MARVIVAVEGEAEDVREALLRLIGGESPGSTTSGSVISPYPQSGGEEGSTTVLDPPVPWTKEELARFWPNLTLPARRVLGEIATRPDGYRFEDLAQALGSA